VPTRSIELIRHRISWNRQYAMFDFLLAVLPQLVVTGLMLGSIYALLALCFCVVHAGTGVINFAQGDFVVIGLVFIWFTYVDLGLPIAIAIPLTIGLTGVVVVVLERLTLARVIDQDPIIPLLVTLALGILIRGVIHLVWGTQPRMVPHFSGDTPIMIAGGAALPQALWIAGGTIVIMVALYLFFTRTLFGLSMRASASDREGAQVIGVNAGLISLYAFGLSALISGAAGALVAPITNVDAYLGLEFSLKGFAGAVLGGIDKPMAAVAGGLFIGFLETFVSGLISSEYRNMVVFGVLMVVLIVRPNGLLGARS
jgi:branched-chain amino acid transport system permease protein